jgi:SecD/SecF fusion protein
MNKDKLLNLTFTSNISKKLLVATRFNFIGNNKKSLTITGVILLICIGSFAIRGLSQSIDFTGGRNFKVQFEKQVEPEQIRSLISQKFGDSNVSVIAIGTDKKTVRISTNYRIDDDSNSVDTEIEAYLYEALKPVLTQNITLETFIDRDNHTGGSIVSFRK